MVHILHSVYTTDIRYNAPERAGQQKSRYIVEDRYTVRGRESAERIHIMSFLFFNKNTQQNEQSNFVEIDEQELADVNGGHRDYCDDDHDYDDDDYCYRHHRHHCYCHHHHHC